PCTTLPPPSPIIRPAKARTDAMILLAARTACGGLGAEPPLPLIPVGQLLCEYPRRVSAPRARARGARADGPGCGRCDAPGTRPSSGRSGAGDSAHGRDAARRPRCEIIAGPVGVIAPGAATCGA